MAVCDVGKVLVKELRYILSDMFDFTKLIWNIPSSNNICCDHSAPFPLIHQVLMNLACS